MINNQEVFAQSETTAYSLELLAVRAEDHIGSDMNGEKVLLSIENGKYYNLGEIGGRIWDLMEYPETVGSIINSLLSEYDIDRTTCESQVFTFLTRLSEERLIRFGI